MNPLSSASISHQGHPHNASHNIQQGSVQLDDDSIMDDIRLTPIMALIHILLGTLMGLTIYLSMCQPLNLVKP